MEFEVGLKKQFYNWHMRRRRIEFGYSQQILAEIVGCCAATIGEIERINYHPSAKLRRSICDMLEIPEEVLFPDEIKGVNLPKIEFMQEQHISLNQLKELSQPELAGLLVSGGIDEAEHGIDAGFLKSEIKRCLSTLTEREILVLNLRFGLNGGGHKTYDEVGKEFGVTRERIRQIEAKALRKLRHPSRSKKLRDYI